MKVCPPCKLKYPNDSTACFLCGGPLSAIQDPLIGTTIAPLDGAPAAEPAGEAEPEGTAAPAPRKRSRGGRSRTAKDEAPKVRSAPKAEAAPTPAPATRRPRQDEREEPDDGWNGPIPSFLGQGFSS